jgi:glucose-6-phosphate 1-dehydrogenase
VNEPERVAAREDARSRKAALDDAVPISGKRAPPCAVVIFGAAGDLTHRKLVPALYHLGRQRLAPSSFAVIGFARREFDDQAFRAHVARSLPEHVGNQPDRAVLDWLSQRTHYVRGSFDEDEAYERLARRLEEVEREHGTAGNVLFYMATAPEHFAPITCRLAKLGLLNEQRLAGERQGEEGNGGWRRVIFEKPFGSDLKSACELNRVLRGVLHEKQIYRIDHYLGKETVQNIMVLRFSNGIFEPIWNRRYVDHVQITVAETLGVETRGGYYDHAGALRDMVPNHVFQLISLVAMEPPVSFQPDSVRDEQAKLMRAIPAFSPEDVLMRAVRGQYSAGEAGSKQLRDYRSEPQVDPESNTETFVALKLAIDNWRWTGVPFYVRVGKALSRRVTEIAIQFRRPPIMLFRDTPIEHLSPNVLALRIQPDEGIALTFGAKIPGAALRLGSVDMDFSYSDQFGMAPATGYERLLFDAMQGDQTLFQRADMLEASWAAVDPILDVWKALPPRQFPNYRAGAPGPSEADQLLARDGRAWRDILS